MGRNKNQNGKNLVKRNMIQKKHKTLVLGIGNDILTDDGIGPKLCDFLKEKFKNKLVDFEKLNVGGLEILEFIQGYKKVIFIDAIMTGNGQIGDVYLYTPGNFRETSHLSNLHDINFLTALKLGKSLDMEIPPKLYIIAVEIKEDLVFSEYFTEELALKYDDVKQKVSAYIEELLPIIDKEKIESEHI